MPYGKIMADVMQDSGNFSLSPSSVPFRNRIINGAMVIDQRNNGASVTATDAGYQLDRWQTFSGAASKFSVQQNAGAVTPPVGFKNYLGVTSLSAYTAAVGEAFSVNQNIEGLNVSDLGWGTANAQTVTISFWVRSSLIGTFSAAFRNSAANRSYPFTYTISATNTWEQKSVTVAGDTTGTWLTTNGIGIALTFDMGSGSNFRGTANAWNSSFNTGATGSVSLVGTNGATFYITGVQLEKGSTATSFDYRPYGDELRRCQRYAQPFGQGSVGRVYSATEVETSNMFRITMRAAPTITFGGFSGSSNKVNQNPAAQLTATAVTSSGLQTTTGTYILYTVTGGTTGNIATVWNGDTCFASAEL